MEVFQTWHGLKEKYPKLAVGLGNFDGVHVGHQKLIRELVAAAKEMKGQALIFTFHPHPATVLTPEKAPPLLLTPRTKEKMIARLGVDILLRVPFTKEFARTSPEEFITSVLSLGLGARAIFVGYDYTFGYKGRGTVALLEDYSKKCGFVLRVVPPVKIDGKIVSSTLIRQLLKAGEVVATAKYLGYLPFVESTVVPGDRRAASALGFPTANFLPGEQVILPANGVYAVRVVVDGEIYLGVANIGVRPTFYGNSAVKQNMEVHLLDFQGDLYGRSLQVFFLRRLREERCFASPKELISQIKQDILHVRGTKRAFFE